MHDQETITQTRNHPEQLGLTDQAPEVRQPRRAKIFTVHGTFAHEADWDNWDPNTADEKKKLSGQPRNFVNRLSDELRERGVVFDHADHTEYNWSGGNSHDERRVAAIGLKKLIEKELTKVQADHGLPYKDYYNGGVYVIGHSHGGTLSRIAINMWDKDADYYQPIKVVDPVTGVVIQDEFKHDDHCAHCKQERHGKVGPNTVERPDLVITLGSPFVTFDDRKNGLLAANVAVWVFRAFMALLLYIYYLHIPATVALMVDVPAAWSATKEALFNQFVKGTSVEHSVNVPAVIALVVPLFLYYVLAYYAPSRLVWQLGERVGRGMIVNAAAAFANLVAVIGLIAVVSYYFLYFSRGTISGPFGLLDNRSVIIGSAWVLPMVLYWFLAISLPGRLLSGLAQEVTILKDRLPTKYDPRSDKDVAYLNYTTPGDEAGMGLTLQGFITWAVQTLWLATACVALCAVIIQIVGFIANDGETGKFLRNASPQQVSRFVSTLNMLTPLPVAAWQVVSWAFGWIPGIASLHPVMNISDIPIAEQPDVVRKFSQAMDLVTVKLLLQLIPITLAMTAVSFLVSKWLRNSEVGFGAERLAWTLASKIAITKRANANSMLRNVVISPRAWWNRDIAHCYYYKCDSVIKDVANFISDRNLHRADRPLPIGRIVAAVTTWLFVLIVCLSIFAATVSVARHSVL